MSSSSAINIADLILPISVDFPVGNDLRADLSVNSLYQQMKDARQAARIAERKQAQGVEGNNLSTKWQAVYDLGIEILTQHSKDLEVASWITEALLRLANFSGLRDGFFLLRTLIENYWESLYPLADEDGISTTTAPLTGLNGSETDGTLIVPIALVALTEGKTVGPFALWQYKQISELSKITDPEKLAKRIADGAVTYEAIELAASETSAVFFVKVYEDLMSCLHEYEALQYILEQKCGEDSPPSSRITSQLNACIDFLRIFAKQALGHLSPESIQQEIKAIVSETTSKENAPLSTNITMKKPTKKMPAVIQNREDALQTILQAADYFRYTEPHSPLSYMLERTVRWGRMPLPELLQELVNDDQTWALLSNLTGISKQ